MKKLITMFALLGVALLTDAAEYRRLDTAEAAYWGATHVAIIDYTDLTSTATNASAQTITNATFGAGDAIMPVCAVLETDFTWSGTNAFNSVTITVGDSDDADEFITSHQVCENGTEVEFKWAVDDNAQAYTTTDYLTMAVTGTEHYSLSQLTQGRYLFYFRKLSK